MRVDDVNAAGKIILVLVLVLILVFEKKIRG